MNLLKSWTDGEHSEDYTYNASGLLSSITTEVSTTKLTWDILYGDGVVISADEDGTVTDYDYGLERISALTGKNKTEYVYDGRGSVAAELSYNSEWYTMGGALSSVSTVTKSYTPFGEQIGEAVSGFGYNGEYYNAATGSIYLRARNYEPAMNRFSQKDILRGTVLNPGSQNRYLYVQNDPMNYIDPSGRTLKSFIQKASNKVANTVKSVVADPLGTIRNTASTVKNAAQSFLANPIKTTINTTVNACKSVANLVKKSVNEIFSPDTSTSQLSGSNGGTQGKPDYQNYGNATVVQQQSTNSRNPSTVANTSTQVQTQGNNYCSTGKNDVNKYVHQTFTVNKQGGFGKFCLYMGGLLIFDVAKLTAVYTIAATLATLTPATAGASAVLAFSLLETAGLAVTSTVSDISVLIDGVTKYSSGIEYTANADFWPASSSIEDIFSFLVLSPISIT